MAEDEPIDARHAQATPSKSASHKAELTPAARRALAEAAERRELADRAAIRPKEVDGRDGPEPVRYGDWEVRGLASDF